MLKRGKILIAASLVVTLGVLTGCGSNNSESDKKKSIEITNVSYDPTRELYEEYNKNFQEYWEKKTGQKKIPFVCNNLGVPCVDILGLCEREGWSF